MGNLLKEAVLNREQQIVREVFVDDEEFYVEDCGCEDIDFDQLVEQIAEDAGEVTISQGMYEDLDYLEESPAISKYVRETLTNLGVDVEAIDDYICETLFGYSFLVVVDGDDGEVNISIDAGVLKDFYATYLEL